MKLARYYQTDQFDSVRSAFNRGVKGVVVSSATGTGKAVAIALITKMVREKGGRVMILVNRDNLVTQLLGELRDVEVFGCREQGEERASLTADVVVGSIQSLSDRWLSKWQSDHFKLVILDECDSSGAPTVKRVLGHFKHCYHVGFTATPERHDKAGLWAGYKEIVFSYPVKAAIDDGWLCGFQFIDLLCRVPVDMKIAKNATFSEDQEVFDADAYLPKMADEISPYCETNKGLFFLPNCRMSKGFTELLQSRGVNAQHIDSSYMPKSKTKELLKWFKETPNAVLSNADLLSVGFNQHDVSLIGLIRPIASIRMYLQRLGRGTRPLANVDEFGGREEAFLRKQAIAESPKPFCTILNPFWENTEHDLASPAMLITDDEEEQKAINKARKPGQKSDFDSLQKELMHAKKMLNQDEEMRKLAEKLANSAEKMHRAKSGKDVWIEDILKQPKDGPSATEPQLRYLYVLSKKDFRHMKLTKKQASRIIGRYAPHKATA